MPLCCASNMTSVRKERRPTSAAPKRSRRGAKNAFHTPGAYTFAFAVPTLQGSVALSRTAKPVSPYSFSARSVAATTAPNGSLAKDGAAHAGAGGGLTGGGDAGLTGGAAADGGAALGVMVGDGAAAGGGAALGVTVDDGAAAGGGAA